MTLGAWRPDSRHLLALGGLAFMLGCGGRAASQGPGLDASVEQPTGGEDLAPEADAPANDVISDAENDAPETSSVPQPQPYRAIAIAVGTYHSCALLDDHNVKCWGQNGYGQLGLGDTRSRGLDRAEMGDALPTVDLGTGRTATAIAAGRYATCAILDTGALKCWGLGSLTGVPGVSMRGDQPGEMGDSLPAVELGPGRTAGLVEIGYYDACVLRDDKTLRCWGTSSAAADVPLAAGATVQTLQGFGGVFGIFDDGSVRGPLSATVPPPVIDLGAGERARAIAGSSPGGCALLESGGVKCWGLPIAGMPTPAARNLSALSVTDTGKTCGILPDGTVRCWGFVADRVFWSNVPGGDDIGGTLVNVGQPAIALAGGAHAHTCALLSDGTVKCWGWEVDATTIAAIGGGADNGVFPDNWRPVDLGTRKLP